MIYILYFLFFITFSVLYFEAPSYLEGNFMGFVLFLDFLLIVSFIFKNFRKLKINIFRHSVFILLGFLIVHFQYLLDFFLNGYVNSPIDIWVDTTIVCRAMVISSFGLLSFLFGYQFYFSIGLTPSVSNLTKKKNTIKPFYPTFLVIVSYLCFFGFVITADTKYLSGYYGSVDAGAAANRFQLLLGILLNASIIVISRNLALTEINKSFITHIKKTGIFLNLLIVIYIGLVLFIGDRGPALSLILIYFSGYVFRVKTKPRPIIIISGLFIGMTLMAFTRSYRATDKSLDFSERVTLAISGNSKYQAGGPKTSELAGSVRTLHYAVSYVPRTIDYKYGWYQVRQILVAIPGMSNVLDYIDPTFSNKGSTKLITFLDQGVFHTYGLGTTVVTDFYTDLGLIGVIFGMFIFGYFIAMFEGIAFSSYVPSLFSFVFIMVYMSKSIYISRSSALFPFQEALWIFMIIILYNFLLRGWFKKS